MNNQKQIISTNKLLVLGCILQLTAFQGFAQNNSSSSKLSKVTKEQSTVLSDKQQINDTINAYFKGRRNADLALLKKAFSVQARLATIATDGKVTIITLDEYYTVVSNKGAVTVRTELNQLQIKNKLAFAEVVFQYSDKSYTDYLVLLKTADSWKIVSKTFIKN